MLTPIANIHHSRLPAPGELVTLSPDLLRRGFYWARRWIVESYPLTDSPDPRYSRGIHTVNLVSVCRRYRLRVSGFWCIGEGD